MAEAQHCFLSISEQHRDIGHQQRTTRGEKCVAAHAALACMGGQMQGRLIASNAEQQARARASGITNLDRTYAIADMVSGDLSFAATGITNGSLLGGVRFTKEAILTQSVVMRASTHTIRWIKTTHADVSKFD